MPSPVGHAIAGLTVHVLAARSRDERTDWRRAAIVTGAALAPDIDLAFRLVDGRNHHGQETHSLGFAFLSVLAALGIAALLRRRPLVLVLAPAIGLAWSTHVLLDYLNVDTSPPIGILALWPLSHAYFKFPWPIFLDVGRTLDLGTIRHNALAAAWECVVLLPVLAWAWRFRTRREGGGPPWRVDSRASR
jgi:inner membrane protein